MKSDCNYFYSENEPVDFSKAVQMSDDSGDMTFRARERIRSHQLIQPVWIKIKKGTYFRHLTYYSCLS